MMHGRSVEILEVVTRESLPEKEEASGNEPVSQGPVGKDFPGARRAMQTAHSTTVPAWADCGQNPGTRG